MFTRLTLIAAGLCIASTGLCIASTAQATAALAEAKPPQPPPVVVGGDATGGRINTTVRAPGTPGRTALRVGSSTSDSGSGVTCTWTAEGQFSQGYLNWLAGTAGTWYDVRCSDGSSTVGLYVPPASGNVPPAVVLAGTLARTAANSLQLPAPRVGHSPAGQALVGLPTWFWADPAQWRVLRQRTTAGPVWAQVSATPMSTTWDPGDGSAVLSCAGPGTPYDRSRPEAAQSTDCAHTYLRSSADRPQTGPGINDRFFTVTVTMSWRVTWQGPGGSGGTLPLLSRQSSFALPVAQRQTVVTGGSG